MGWGGMVIQVALVTCNQEGLCHPQLQDTVELPEEGHITLCLLAGRPWAEGEGIWDFLPGPGLEEASSEVCLYIVP